jgi:hypothetical protein
MSCVSIVWCLKIRVYFLNFILCLLGRVAFASKDPNALIFRTKQLKKNIVVLELFDPDTAVTKVLRYVPNYISVEEHEFQI